ncbi:hypothetical protein D3C85_1775100 [compost metagenome]
MFEVHLYISVPVPPVAAAIEIAPVLCPFIKTFVIVGVPIKIGLGDIIENITDFAHELSSITVTL